MNETARFSEAFQRFDAANAEDPNRVGDEHAEVVYSRRMTDWLTRLYPDASEALKLAARAQHIRRWTIPRSKYPMTRAGYHQWRTGLYSFHAQTAGEILQSVGYDTATISRVQALLRKEKLKADAETQALEDVICLVFLENYLEPFAPRHEEEKVVKILRRTWLKMSERGRQAALKLELPESAMKLITKALQSGQGDSEAP